MNTIKDPECVSMQEYVMQEPLLYGDYGNALKDGEERLYEDQVSFENVFALFSEVGYQTITYFVFMES